MMEELEIPLKGTAQIDERRVQEQGVNGDSNDTDESRISVQQGCKMMSQRRMWLFTLPDSRCERMKDDDSETANAVVRDSKGITNQDMMKLFTACEELTGKTSTMRFREA